MWLTASLALSDIRIKLSFKGARSLQDVALDCISHWTTT